MRDQPVAATKFKGFLGGVDAEILAHCPPRDHDNVSTIAWMLIGIWVWQTTVFALVTHLTLAQPGEIRPELIGAAMLLATLILLLDSYMVIRSSWYLSGLEELKRAGLRLQGLWSARIKNGVFLAIRILIAILLALLNGVFTGTLILRKDIDGEIARAHQARLAPVVEAARQRIDGELQRNAEARDQGRAWIAKADEEVARLRRTALEPVTDPELQAAIARVTRLKAAKATAADGLAQAQTFASAELAGRRESGDNSGVPGTGPVRRAAEERRPSRSGRSRPSARPGSPTLAELEETYQRRTAQRDGEIRTAIEHDPAYAARGDGFLARVKAPVRLTADPWIGGMVLLFDAAFFLIELAAGLAKVASFVPSTYATMLAREELGRAHLTSRALAADINGTPPEAPQPVEQEPEPPLASEVMPPHDETQGDIEDETAADASGVTSNDAFRFAAKLARVRARRNEKVPARPTDPIGGSRPMSDPGDRQEASDSDVRRGPPRLPGSKNRSSQPSSELRAVPDHVGSGHVSKFVVLTRSFTPNRRPLRRRPL